MNRLVKKFVLGIKNAVYPVRCPYCKQLINSGEYACIDCKSKFPKTAYKIYAVGSYPCSAAFPYCGVYSEAVKQFKFSGKYCYAEQLAHCIVNAVQSIHINVDFDLVTCVPMHKDLLYKREYNHSRLLAKSCAEILDIPYVDTLEQFKKNQVQHRLNAVERQKNVQGVFRPINDCFKDKRVLLIDDIITTGSTLGECARVLMEHGCGTVYCAVICAVL